MIRIKNPFKARRERQAKQFVKALAAAGIIRSAPKTFNDVYSALIGNVATKNSAYVGYQYLASSLVGNRISGTEFFVYDKKKPDAQPIKEHGILDLLANPSPNWTAKETLKMISVQVDLYGESFLQIVMGPDATPYGLEILDYRALEKRYDYATGQLKHYEYSPFGSSQRIKFIPEQLCRIREVDPENFRGGKAVVGAGPVNIDFETNAGLVSNNTLKNGISPSSIFMPKEKSLPTGAAGKLKAQIKENHVGPDNAGKSMFVNLPLDFKMLTPKPSEMKTVETLKYMRGGTMAFNAVPPVSVGMETASQWSTAEIAEDGLHENRLNPRNSQIVDGINKHVMPLFNVGLQPARGGDYFEVVRMETLRLGFVDKSPVSAEKRAQMIASGSFTINEIRATFGMPPVAWGEEIAGRPQQAPAQEQENNEEEDEGDDND